MKCKQASETQTRHERRTAERALGWVALSIAAALAADGVVIFCSTQEEIIAAGALRNGSIHLGPHGDTAFLGVMLILTAFVPAGIARLAFDEMRKQTVQPRSNPGENAPAPPQGKYAPSSGLQEETQVEPLP